MHSDWVALQRLFRSGSTPDPLPAGFFTGWFAAVDIAPLLDQLAGWVAFGRMPWKGKVFNPDNRQGANIVTGGFKRLARGIWPGYLNYREIAGELFEAFPFAIYRAPGIADPDRIVLKLDYNLSVNPGASVRRILDELVQLEPDLYLGKAHFKWWWGNWQTWAFFFLKKS